MTTLRRIPVWVGYTDPSAQEAAAEIAGTDVIGVGLVLDLSTAEVRLSDGRTDYDDLPVVTADLDIDDIAPGDGTIALDGGGLVRFHSLSAPFQTIPNIGMRNAADAADRTVIGGGGIAFGDGTIAADVGIGHASANRASVINPAGGNAWLTLPADPVNGTDAARKSWVDTQITNLIAAAPGALNTLDELAAALGDDANFAATVTTALAGKAAAVHTHVAADVTDFNTAVRTNQVDQLAVPTSNMVWPSASVTAGGVGAATSVAADGAVLALASSGLGGGILLIKSNSGDANARAQLSVNGLALGPGGASATDVSFTRTGTNAASITVTTLTIAGNLTLSARSIITDTTTGLKIGTAVTQKLGFFNATPVVQPSGAAQAASVTTAATQTTPWGFSTQAQADGIITLLNAIRTALVNEGLIKGSA